MRAVKMLAMAVVSAMLCGLDGASVEGIIFKQRDSSGRITFTDRPDPHAEILVRYPETQNAARTTDQWSDQWSATAAGIETPSVKDASVMQSMPTTAAGAALINTHESALRFRLDQQRASGGTRWPPGLLIVSAEVVDARGGSAVSVNTLAGRLLGISTPVAAVLLSLAFVLGLGCVIFAVSRLRRPRRVNEAMLAMQRGMMSRMAVVPRAARSGATATCGYQGAGIQPANAPAAPPRTIAIANRRTGDIPKSSAMNTTAAPASKSGFSSNTGRATATVVTASKPTAAAPAKRPKARNRA